jgi:hypothetical protein
LYTDGQVLLLVEHTAGTSLYLEGGTHLAVKWLSTVTNDTVVTRWNLYSTWGVFENINTGGTHLT